MAVLKIEVTATPYNRLASKELRHILFLKPYWYSGGRGALGMVDIWATEKLNRRIYNPSLKILTSGYHWIRKDQRLYMWKKEPATNCRCIMVPKK